MDITVNGQRRPMGSTAAHTTTLDWLRNNGLTGCKEGCAEGECGACAILVAQPDAHGGTAWTSVNACLIPVAALDGQEVITSEGLGTPQNLHPVQEELAIGGGSQCGYCTPGFVVAARSLLNNKPKPTLDEIKHYLSGNICRCGTYGNMFNAILEASGQPVIMDQKA